MPRHSWNYRPSGHLYYRGSKRNPMECTRLSWAKTKLQNVESGPPPSTVMDSVVEQVAEVSVWFTYLGSDVAWTLAFTGALVSHPPHCPILVILSSARDYISISWFCGHYTLLPYIYLCNNLSLGKYLYICIYIYIYIYIRLLYSCKAAKHVRSSRRMTER